MRLSMVLIGLIGFPITIAQEVCGSNCNRYETDSIGRVICPGTNFLSRTYNQDGDCKSHFELAGGYGCCCGCP